MTKAGLSLATPLKKKVHDLPLFMLRVAGLPIDELQGMRIPSTIDLLDQMVQKKKWIASHTQPIVDQIEQEVPKQESDKIRNQLIQYKRDIFNHRFPKKNSQYFVPFLSDGLCDQMKQWEDVWKAVQELEVAAEQQFERDLVTSREVLQAVIQDPHFLGGIVLTSRDLYYKVKKYIETPVSKQKARLRKVEYALSKYISRVAAKTSPFSTFTSVGIGKWTEQKNGMVSVPSLALESYVQLNHANVLRVVNGLIKHPDVKKHLSYKVNPTLIVDEGKVKYIRRVDDSKQRARVFQTLETPVSLNYTPAIQAVFSQFHSSAKVDIQYMDLLNTLADSLSTAPENVAKFLNQLIDLSILVPKIELYEQTEDIIQSVLSLIEQWPVEIARQTGERLQEMREIVANYSSATMDQRASALQRLKQIYQTICTDLEIEISETSLGLLIYEDVVLKEQASFSKEHWKTYLDDLAAYQEIAPIFDIKLRIQSAISQKFIELYGEDGVCEKPGQFLSMVIPTITDFYPAFLPNAMPEDIELKNEIESIRVLNELKREFGDLVRKRLMEKKDEVHFTREELASFGSRIPEMIAKRPLSHDCFVQLVSRGEGKDRLVLNQMYLGNATFFSRFSPYFDEEEFAEELRKHLLSIYGAEGTLAEVSGVYGFNANLHPRLTPYELALPMLSPTRPEPENQIDWQDIVMVYNKEQDRVMLRHPVLGEVTTLFLGTLIPMLVPFIVNFMATNFSNGHFNNMFHLFLEQGLTEEEQQQVRIYPRVSVGQVVVARKKWIFPRSQLVLRETRESDFSYFVRIHEWRKKWNLPDRLFFRMSPARDQEGSPFSVDPQSSEAAENVDFTDFKPQYLDFENPLLVRMFGKMIADSSFHVIIEEMLPDIEELALIDEGKGYVSELLVELSQRV